MGGGFKKFLSQTHVTTWFTLQTSVLRVDHHNTQVKCESGSHWSLNTENFPSVSQLQKHLCWIALCLSLWKYGVQQPSIFLISYFLQGGLVWHTMITGFRAMKQFLFHTFILHVCLLIQNSFCFNIYRGRYWKESKN